MEHVFPEIDYSLLFSALNYYKKQGFIELSVPWVVPRETCEQTMPTGIVLTEKLDLWIGTLVGSAEQSFFQLAKEGKLKQDLSYVALTPCFRYDNYDELHFPYFMKIELFRLGKEDFSFEFMESAMYLFKYVGLDSFVETTNIGHDLVSKTGIELGSYGHRTVDDLSWTYGTGLAEPRFTTAYNMERAKC